MISTITTREQQLANGFFRSGSGPTQVLILGSCRTLAYLNYLIRYNEGRNQMTITRIDPCDWHWNQAGENVDVQAVLDRCETDERILAVLRSTDIFIHEHLGNYAMFNTDPRADKNIFQYGMEPETEISIPNFHDHFILYNDFVDFGALTDDWFLKGAASVEKFCDLCLLTDFPEFGDIFRDTWMNIRYFWRPNHTSGAFTYKIFELMNDKFLHMALDNDFLSAIRAEDQFKDPHTEVHEKDREAYDITW